MVYLAPQVRVLFFKRNVLDDPLMEKIATPQTMWNLNTHSSHFSSEHLLSWWLWEIKLGSCSFNRSVSCVTSLKEHPLIPLRYFPGVPLLAPVTWLRSVRFLCCSVASTSQSNEVRTLSSTSSYSFPWANPILSPSPFTTSLNNHTCCAEFHLPVQISQQSLSLLLVFLFHLFKPCMGMSSFASHRVVFTVLAWTYRQAVAHQVSQKKLKWSKL